MRRNRRLRAQEREASNVGWGGAIGIGGAKANASITFSQRGNTTISGSMTTGIKGIQLTASSTTNGATTIGVNYNPSDKGPRQGWNVGANYDVNGGGFSASVGYTNSKTGEARKNYTIKQNAY